MTQGHEGDGASSRADDAELLARSERSEAALDRAATRPALEVVAEPSLELAHDADPESFESFEPASVNAPSLEPMVLSNHALDLASSEMHVEPHRSAVLTPSEISIPPVGDLAIELEPVADRFFSEGETVAARVHGEDAAEWDDVATKASRKSLPEVVQRRARFAKYVRWAVGGASLLCVAALGRTMISPSAQTPAHSPVAAAVVAPQAPAPKAATPEVAAVAPAAAPPAPTVELAPAAPAAEVAAAAPAPEPSEPTTVAAPKVDVPKAEAPAAPAAATISDKTALQEKNDARRALERGKTADAIEAGERSVALDPTDGEAWLLLGAAYQEKGKGAEARRCYTSCVKEGKRGPVGECRAMLR